MMTETDTKPVAWMYECGSSRIIKDCQQPHFDGYAETPLYASPQPCTDCDKLREEVERLRGAMSALREAAAAAIRALKGGKHGAD